MSFACSASLDQAGALRALVASADCNSRHYAEAGYLALTGSQSFFPAALTAVLVIMVALIGFRLMLGLGGIRVNDVPVLALKVGAVLALTMQWPLFEALVFNLAYDAPLQVAAVTLHGDAGQSTKPNPLNDAQIAYDQLQQASADISRDSGAPGASDAIVRGRAAEDLAHAARTLLMTSAGALSAALVAIGIFTALGPLFLAMLLLTATADLFLGWLRAMIAAAFAPMLIWANTALLTAMVRPDLNALQAQAQNGTVDLPTVDQVVTIIGMFALTQIALLALGVAAALGLGFTRKRGPSARPAAPVQRLLSAPSQLPRTEQLAEMLRSTSLLRSVPTAATASIARNLLSNDQRSALHRPATVSVSVDRTGGWRRTRFRDRSAPGSRRP
jgi:type IV secretion system protein VirB6